MLSRFRGSNPSYVVAKVLRLRSSVLQPASRSALSRVDGAVRGRSSSCVRSGVDLVQCPTAAARGRLCRPASFSRSVATSSREKGQRHAQKPSKAKHSHSAKNKRAHRQPRQNGGAKAAPQNARPARTNGNNANSNRPHDHSPTVTTAYTFSRKKLGSLAAVEDQLRNLGSPGYLPATSLSVAQCIHACVVHGDIPAAVHILSQLTHTPLGGGSTEAGSDQAPLKLPNLTSQRERQRQHDQKEQGLGHVADTAEIDDLLSAPVAGARPEFGEGAHPPAPDAGVYARFIFACAQVNDREAYEHAVGLLRWAHKRVFAGEFDASGKMVDAWAAVAQASGRHAKAPAMLRVLADFPSCPIAQQHGEVNLPIAAARVFGEAIHRSGHKRAERAEQVLELYESKGYGIGGCSDDSSIHADSQGRSVTRVYDEMALIYTATKNWEAVDLIFQSLRRARLPCTGACLAVFTSIDRSLPPEAAMRMRNMSAAQVEEMTASDSPAGIIRRLAGYVDEELARGSPRGRTLVPAAEVYNKAISALSKLGDCDGSLRALQLGLKAASRSASSNDDGVPSSEAARSLISVCCAFRRFDEATGLLNMMGSQWGLQPTAQQYKSVISALAQQPPRDKSQPAERARRLIATLLADLGRNPSAFETAAGSSQGVHVKSQGKKNAKGAKGHSSAAEGSVLYDCFYSAVQAQIKAGLWKEALAIAVELPVKQRNATHGQSLATLYPPGSSAAAAASGTSALSLDTVACGAEECDVKLTTIVVKAAMKAEDWDAVLAVHNQLVTPQSELAAAAVAAAPEANVQRRMEQAFRAFDVQYFRAVAAAMFKRRRWADALKLRSLWVQRHPSRGCLQIARTLLYAAERTNAVEEGLEVLEDLQLRKRRIKAELPVAAAIRLLERRGGQSDRACEMLDRWLNDVSYGQLSPPGYDTFQSVARACLAEGKDQMSREVIAKRKKFHNRVKEDTPTAPELNNLF